MNVEQRISERLSEKLRLNVQISPKQKAQFEGNTRGYFLLREREKDKVIMSNFGYAFFKEECTAQEIEALDLSLLGDFRFGIIHAPDLMLICISALKTFIDNGEHETPVCLAIKGLYEKVKSALSSQIPFEEGDSFADYLASKQPRADILEARTTGKLCIFCGSKDIASNGNLWKCRTCGKSFRKHNH